MPRPATRALAAALLFAALAPAPALAQNDPPTAKIDAYVNAQRDKQRIPGVSVAVVRDGKLVLARGYGLANVEHQVPVKPETIFQSGSVGKQFTATAVMMLVEEGKVGLDDSVTKYFPDAPAAWKQIKVRNLLSHTGGTTDYPSDFDFRRDFTEDELLKRAEAIPLAYTPGEKWSYSNLGYVLLGILIHKVTGKFYGDVLRERIFTPLGMTTARIISEADIVPNRAAGYVLVKGELKNQEWVSPTLNTTADGALYLTALDMAKWDAALYTDKLLKPASLELMWTPVKLSSGKATDYGFGWSIGEVHGHRIIEHGGAWQGFTCHIARYPDRKLTVVVFTNLAQANPGKIAHGVAALYDPELAPAPVVAIEDKEPQVTAMLKDLLAKLADNAADPNVFDAEMRARLFPDRAAEAAAFLKELGGLKALELVGRSDEDEARVYRYRAAYEGTALMVTMSIGKDGLISGLGIRPE